MRFPWRRKKQEPITEAYRARILILGSAGVGKTSLVSRFCRNSFKEETVSTIGVEVASKTVTVGRRSVRLQCWDLAGQERYRAVCRAYYRGAGAAVLLFDLGKPASFSALQHWIKELECYNDCLEPSNTPLGPPVLLLGNKADQDERAVSRAEIAAFMKQHDIPAYFEVSAKTGTRVLDAFRRLAAELLLRVDEAKRCGLHLENILQGICLDEEPMPAELVEPAEICCF